MISWARRAMALGLIILVLRALTLPAWSDGWRYFAVGALAALVAAAAGGALGLLFGLPISGQVVIVNSPPAQPNPAPAQGQGQTTSAVAPARSQAQAQANDWFNDNTSMEQIADWLTKIIVGLTLTQWRDIQIQFDRLAAAVTAAMQGTAAATGPWADAGKVPGGLIVGGYAILGFLTVYLWARRYLSLELSAARRAMRDQQAKSARDIARAAGMRNLQLRDRTSVGPETAERAVAEESVGASNEESVGAEFPAPIQPGSFPGDPWKNQFGGRDQIEGVQVAATVQPLDMTDWFDVELQIRAIGDQAAALRNKRARIYLHPTFEDPIRMAVFDARGEIRIPLICYGAFTVGVQLEDGRTLELDLSMLPNAPVEFRTR